MIRSSSSTTNPRGKRNARWTGLFERIGIDAGKFPAQTPRMAKKAEAKTATETQRRRVGKQPADAGSLKSGWLGASASLRQKPSALLDTRVVYCGDNLEQLAKLPDACVDLIYIDPPRPMQNEEGRMMKPVCFPILHSSFILLNSPVTGSFYYPCDWHAGHYVKVMLN
jgi:hypothetical protein